MVSMFMRDIGTEVREVFFLLFFRHFYVFMFELESEIFSQHFVPGDDTNFM